MDLLEFVNRKRRERERQIAQFDNIIFDSPIEIERRAYQRNINLRVKPSGVLKVTAGKTISMLKVQNFLKIHRDWILKTQAEFLRVKNQYPQKQFVEGEMFLLFGKEYQLVFVNRPLKKIKLSINNEHLIGEFSFKNKPSQQEFKNALQSFYKKIGRALLTERVEEWSDKMGLHPTQLSFRSQKTRWGSCNSRGHVSLNWRLVAAPLEVLDYVVIHELAHLRYQNHSRIFWQLVKEFSPKYKEHKIWLRQQHFAFDFLAKTSELYL